MRRGGARAVAALGLLAAAVLGLAAPASAQQDVANMVIRSLGFDGGAVAAGGTIGLSLEFVNRGPGNVAPGTRAVINFNRNVIATVVGANPPISCNGGPRVVCNAGNALEGVRFNVRVSVQLAAGAAPGNLVATARVTSNLPDPEPGNEERSASASISSTANLVLTQSISPNPPQAGGNATIQPRVTNNGPSPAENVVVTVNVPGGVTVVSAGGCSLGGGRLTCGLGRLAPGAAAGVQIVYGLGGLAAGSQVTASASVRSSTPDPNNGNNSVAQTFTIGAATADVSIRKTASPNPVGIGGTVTFAVVVSNAGPSAARGVVVTDTLPAGLRLAGADAPGSCASLGRTVICNVGTLGAGDSTTVVISAAVQSSARVGQLVNRVTVQTETADRNPGNNTASVAIEVRRGGVAPNRGETRPTVASNDALPTTTVVIGALPPTGAEGAPLGVAAIVLSLGIVLLAGAYRGRRAPS
jgi:uncharacterized repeat protein (TIGR01451 family)